MSMLVTETLGRELSALHPEQRAAVLQAGNVVLRAGPGSGKTRTLVARIAYVLQTQISPFRGVACITYTNSAAEEIRRRVLRSGGSPRSRLSCSTVHSFCLNEILRAFAPLTNQPAPEAGCVLSEAATKKLLQDCFDQVGIADLIAQYRVADCTRIRRAIACGEPLVAFDAREVEAAQLYNDRLDALGAIDFEAMVTRALQVVREYEPVRELLRARFPHLIVDEYQDLGGVLHELVVALHDLAGIAVFAVGDIDQTVYGFTGADGEYLNQLAAREDFFDLELDINYRSGQEIITASEAVLGASRGRKARAGAPPGNVELHQVNGGLEEHARLACDLVQEARDQHVRPERIAILYPNRGPLLDAMRTELASRKMSFLDERDDKFPSGTLSRFVQRCASRAITNYQIHGAEASERADMLRRAESPSGASLARSLLELRREALLPEPLSRLSIPRALQSYLDPQTAYPAEAPAGAWLQQLRSALDLDAIAASHPDQDNVTCLDNLLLICETKNLMLQDLAQGEEVIGKSLLTTYHSAKGREFDTVILPGLLSGIIPRDVKSRTGWRPPTIKELAEQRRAFYVALTRAEKTLHLITGPGYDTPYGRSINRGPSEFVLDMATRLS